MGRQLKPSYLSYFIKFLFDELIMVGRGLCSRRL